MDPANHGKFGLLEIIVGEPECVFFEVREYPLFQLIHANVESYFVVEIGASRASGVFTFVGCSMLCVVLRMVAGFA